MLSVMVGTIFLRALHRDIARYNSFASEEGTQEDYGWKLVHADVFRPPPHRMALSILVGNGSQLLAMAAVTLLFAVIGVLSPSNRGALSTVTIALYVCFGSISGYVSARIYKMNQGAHWRQNVVLTALAAPGAIFSIFIILNFFLVGAGSSAAVPFGTMLALMSIWFLVSAPLSCVGSYFGLRQSAIEHPCKISQIPRQIPSQPYYFGKWVTALVGGILAFGSIFIELYFIMNSLWFHRVYYVFGFLFFVFLLLIVTCSEVAILLCYFQLCSEDYQWSWRAFTSVGFSGFYVFAYSCIYYVRKLNIGNVPSAFLYFGWSLVISVLVTCITGSVGYIACLLFVRKVFASIKVD
ncbi:transmembrane 9 superfamily member 2 [Blyttiomyces helicus]|uniref:Transmembrane 9 superfamily member n=1 Tax=Blyttiomyces helicus TaxID=388810 RepID=A0A4P9VZI3_9FUNG|nr:transmembrane 9 superfamily member 2 [Blyttiomyces helicus]|eukprot:RKO85229.1 transmembrane 9 superfamily member 2 [Blyttiomyces helicus]